MYSYFDSSAFVKLVIPEEASVELKAWVDGSSLSPISNDLLHTEILRAVRRRAPQRLPDARHLLSGVLTASITTSIADRAAWLEPPSVRSLDALHVATALEIGDGVHAFVTYDTRMQECARAHGFDVVAPGA
ncbi:ribonuclease VapC [Cnuibacter physcomitrellae]|uniref:Uncharacterized protein n=1 Tax=Cnuibacter physcomitrellae TaxID=1619308 RepID=A0A1X9LF83_9MICO|nr:type II toxin-antitoxin system VapC family toxin [Cnuibacter physcomitrellae]ARJ03803.1 hypothetical protein B5808_00055 [Cnuibacter physcomitrellae]GGI39538.1 ribonuclease VapC [Cnuibacter physcomitrellae]